MFTVFLVFVAIGLIALYRAQGAQLPSLPGLSSPDAGQGQAAPAPSDPPVTAPPSLITIGASDRIQSIAQAIAFAEGFGVSGVIPTLRHNPGDLTSGGTIIGFASDQAGWNALYNQINLILNNQSQYYTADMTWLQIGTIWAQDPSGTWAGNVASKLGVDPNSTIGQYASS